MNMTVKERAELRKHDPSSASNIIRRVEKDGAIKMDTLPVLCEHLNKMNLKYHIAVEVESGSLLKTIDNEADAQRTIDNIRRKLEGNKE